MTRDEESADPAGAPHRAEETVEPWARPVGAALAGAFTLALLGLAGFYLYELAIGASDSPVRVVMSIVLFLLFAAAGAAMARGWWRGLTWPATPTLVIGALFIPTAWTLVQGGSIVPGLLIGAAGVAGIAVGWKGRSADL
ncbi:hypothetical protein GA707_16610 [Nostocoides sp. F2B08]|uniref:hypothetical protein n=1 Tax=Nostocoides sp. F2B08 TaxID=2653936 RepID=UPI00126352CE|nr:hypothetical protein [Tetrasphaera sp. F2B08]KAB7741837.1 hypothetical protein GA707_16610 [Tetrasphaera sp. F2B08]